MCAIYNISVRGTKPRHSLSYLTTFCCLYFLFLCTFYLSRIFLEDLEYSYITVLVLLSSFTVCSSPSSMLCVVDLGLCVPSCSNWTHQKRSSCPVLCRVWRWNWANWERSPGSITYCSPMMRR